MSDEKLLSAAELQREIGITGQRLQQWRRQGYVRATRGQKGTRLVYLYPKTQLSKLRLLKQYVDQGTKLKAAYARAERESSTADRFREPGGPTRRRLPLLLEEAEGDEVALFFTAFCLRRNLSEDEVNRRLRKWGVAVGQFVPSQRRNREDGYLFAEVLGGKRWGLREVRTLAQVFNIHALMLDPLFSRTTDAECVVLNLREDLKPVGDGRDRHYGVDCEYRIPWIRLKDAGVAFGSLSLGAGGTSDVHSHPGDELILVLKGEIVLRFNQSGMSTVLRQGDYAHFYAEQVHSATNSSDKRAELFVIRFYQLELDGAREELQQWTRSVAEARFSRGQKQHSVRLGLLPWLQAISHAPEIIEDLERSDIVDTDLLQTLKVHDPWGLGRTLTQIREHSFKGSFQGISSQKWSGEQLRMIEAGLWELVLDGSEPSFDDLQELASAYQIEEILLYQHLFPAVPQVVVVRREIDRVRSDYVPCKASTIAELNRSPPAEYLLPRRNLMCSDVSILRVRMEPGSQTPPSKHPGTEFVLPLRGKLSLSFPDNGGEHAISAEDGVYAHYRSDWPHVVRNLSSEPAEVLAIRFSTRWHRKDGQNIAAKQSAEIGNGSGGT